jgi:hypothetical protein
MVGGAGSRSQPAAGNRRRHGRAQWIAAGQESADERLVDDRHGRSILLVLGSDVPPAPQRDTISGEPARRDEVERDEAIASGHRV